MTSLTPRCRVVYDDDWRPELADALESDPSEQALQRGVEELAEALGALVDRPAEVSLVVAVGLASAVQRRQPGVPYHAARGSGTVAARTMQRPDGHIDVIIETGFLIDVDENGQGPSTPSGLPQLSSRGLAQMKKTIIHEAQHATMHQRGSDWDQFEIPSHADAYPSWDYVAAAKITDEYRAEWNADQHPPLRRPPSVKDVLEVLAHLGEELAAADVRYQSSPTPEAVPVLMEDVYNACASFWTAMAYWAAQFRSKNLDVDTEIEDLVLWKRYVGPTWAGLLRTLDAVPVEDLSASGMTLRAAAARIAEWIPQSLRHIGFRHLLTAEGEAFYIERHDFPNVW